MKIRIYGLFILTFIFQKAAASELVEVKLGNDNYKIPSIYLSPNKDIKPQIERHDSIEIGLFLPNYSGFTKERNYPTVGKYNPNQISLLWTESGKGEHFDSKKRLSYSIKYELVEQNGTRVDNFLIYKNLYNDGITYLSTNREDDEVMIDCNGIINKICKLAYLNSKRKIGILIVFDQSHLPIWTSINDELVKMIDGWKR